LNKKYPRDRKVPYCNNTTCTHYPNLQNTFKQAFFILFRQNWTCQAPFPYLQLTTQGVQFPDWAVQIRFRHWLPCFVTSL